MLASGNEGRERPESTWGSKIDVFECLLVADTQKDANSSRYIRLVKEKVRDKKNEQHEDMWQ